MSEAKAIGIDIGSTTWKAVVVDSAGEILASRVELADPLIAEQTDRLISELRAEIGTNGDIPVVATGYGRKRVKADRILTEITCHARGAWARGKQSGVLVDIGGQDTKVIHIAENGEVVDFHMNDKCAAGTGRFLEVILGRLKVPMDQIAQSVAKAEKIVPVSSTCTVFAESEVVSLVAQGEDINSIVKGLILSLASRVSALAGRIPNDAKIMMSGGVALNPAMVEALSQHLGKPVNVLPDPQLIGALGAALSIV